jgi:hypothetical protein
LNHDPKAGLNGISNLPPLVFQVAFGAKRAKALKLAIPSGVLAIADDVLE